MTSSSASAYELPVAPGVRAALDACAGLRGRDLLSIRDLTAHELRDLLALARDVKRGPSAYARELSGKTLATIFEKMSLRTRVSFHVAAYQLGGHVIDLSPQDVGLRGRESITDVARTLERMVDGIMIRAYSQTLVERLAAAASIPVINGLTDFSHPCQALADFMTMQEAKGALSGLRLAFIGDGNNVANSLILGAALSGVHMTVASPARYAPQPDVLAWARKHEVLPGTACRVVSSPEEAVKGADVVYTDTWISMGQEAQAEKRRSDFRRFQVTNALLERAAPDVIFMHCLPAHRGEEVAANVIDSPRSVVFTQAENRLHSEKALLLALMSSPRSGR
jgi:ornithine carbamoyltransferase